MSMAQALIASVSIAPAGSTLDPSLKGANVILSNGNLDGTKSGAAYQTVYGTAGHNSGRYAFEFIAVAIPTDGSLVVGIADKTNSASVIATFLGNNAGSVETLGVNDFSTGRYYRRMTIGNINGSASTDFLAGDVITVDVNITANTATFYKNGVAMSIGAVAITSGKTYFPAVSIQNGGIARFRSTGLAYLPSGSTEWG